MQELSSQKNSGDLPIGLSAVASALRPEWDPVLKQPLPRELAGCPQRLCDHQPQTEETKRALMKAPLACVAALSAMMCVAGLGSPAQAQDFASWQPYTDSNATRVDFPMGLFPRREGPAEQGEGERFRSSDGRAQLSVYSVLNAGQESPAQYLRSRLKVSPGSVTYRRVTPRFYVLSSVAGEFIYYNRCNFQQRVHCIFLTYPAAEKRAWDAVVTRLSLSLRPLGGYRS